MAALLIMLASLRGADYAYQATHPLTGRHIANVMGVGGATGWRRRPERESEENVENPQRHRPKTGDNGG